MTSLVNTLQRPLLALGLDKRLPILVTLCLVVLLAHSLAVLTWKVLPAPVIAPIAPIIPGGVATKPPTRATQVHQISEWHLFGDAATAPTPSLVAKQEFVPETRLNLKLRGVVASSNPRLASAIIADERNVEDTYLVGDALPGEATLREIHTDRVILEYRGRLETLKLAEEDNASRRPSVARAAPSQFDSQANVGINSADLQPSELLSQYRDALINDPQSLMDLVRATPVEDPESGQLKGFRISPGKDRALLGRFGLRSGDIVTAVNGIPLDNPIKGLEIMQQLSTASAVSLQVDRRGESLNMEFNIQE